MSTSCVFPLPLSAAFRLSAESGFDGVEVMVTHDPTSQSPSQLKSLSALFGQPILSIHAPVLALTPFVFGLSAKKKLEKSAELARAVGATTVVVHPPFRWQSRYSPLFSEIVGEVAHTYGLEVAVENMFAWRRGDATIDAYAPTWNPAELPVDHLTLDFSHAALNGSSAMELATAWGSKLRHVHLCDGTHPDDNPHLFDEHLPPGHGTQPVAEVLGLLASTGFDGHVIAEVATKNLKGMRAKWEALVHTAEFARTHAVAKPIAFLEPQRELIRLAS
jgi:sugar phosphate isomerase/epimerase